MSTRVFNTRQELQDNLGSQLAQLIWDSAKPITHDDGTETPSADPLFAGVYLPAGGIAAEAEINISALQSRITELAAQLKKVR